MIRDGENGFVFDPVFRDECREKVERLIKDPGLRQKMGEAASRTMKNGYTWNHAARKVEAIMKKAAESGEPQNA